MEKEMKYKDFKQTDIYKNACVCEVFSAKTGIEFNDDFPESELEEMVVVSYSCYSDWITIILK